MQQRNSVCTRRCWRATENVDALQALEGLYRTSSDEQRLAAILTKNRGGQLNPRHGGRG